MRSAQWPGRTGPRASVRARNSCGKINRAVYCSSYRPLFSLGDRVDRPRDPRPSPSAAAPRPRGTKRDRAKTSVLYFCSLADAPLSLLGRARKVFHPAVRRPDSCTAPPRHLFVILYGSPARERTCAIPLVRRFGVRIYVVSDRGSSRVCAPGGRLLARAIGSSLVSLGAQ